MPLDNDERRYRAQILTVIGEQHELLKKYWPNGIRNVLSGKLRLIFGVNKELHVGLAGHDVGLPLRDFIRTDDGLLLSELLYSLSSYVWKRMHNKGSGVEMPAVELPSARKYTHDLPPGGRAVIGYTDLKNPNVQVDIPGEIGPGSGPRQIGPGNPLLPPGKK